MNRKYIRFITELKQNILQSRYIAARLANKEQLQLYFKTGKMLSEKITAEKWGAKVIEQIASELHRQLPGLRGFSYRNLMKMKQLAEEYRSFPILPSLTAELPKKKKPLKPVPTVHSGAFWGITFTHHLLILNKCKAIAERIFYIHQAAARYWSVTILEHHIDADLYSTQGRLPNNFKKALPQKLKPSALQVFQDEYLMDFISSSDTEDERVFEGKVVAEIKEFILRMGKGFAFLGNQYRLEIGEEEFFVDLLFFNRFLQCLVAFELKRGKFKPEYAGQLNFYLNVLDEKVKLKHENPSIGIILCKEKNNTIVEFAVKTVDKAMGVATYKTSKKAPREMQRVLPNAKDLVKLL